MDVIMKNFLETAATVIVPVLSISPIPEDHCTLQDILNRLQGTLDPRCAFTLHTCTTRAAALAALAMRQFEVVVCERELRPGSWKDVLDEAVILPDPPSVIVTSRLADERLWAEALNLGAYDVLTKPFDRTEATRVLDAAWRTFGSTRRIPAHREHYKVAAASAG